MSLRQPRVIVALLLVATAALFAVGTTVERGVEGRPTKLEVTDVEEGQETMFEVDLETPLFVVIGIAVSLALAALVWFQQGGVAFALAAVFCLVFAALDVREILYQFDEERTLLAIVAAVLTLGHLSIVVLAGRAARTARRTL